jgi:hypothetical protein
LRETLSVVDTLRRELRGAGVGDLLVAALLFSAFYLDPVAGGGPWSLALIATCFAGLVAIVRDPRLIRTLPLPLVAYVVVYLAAGLAGGLHGGSDVGRYLVRPVAIGALALWMLGPDVRRRTLILALAAIAPQVAFALFQSVRAIVEHGRNAVVAADSVTGSLGSSEANTLGLVAIAGVCIVVALHLAGLLRARVALVGGLLLLSICILASTRAAVLLVPLVAAVLCVGVALALRGRAPVRALAVCAVLAALSVPAIYGATEGLYPGSFVGAFSNQSTHLLDGELVDRPPAEPSAGGPVYTGPHGVQVLPGRREQIRLAVRISDEEGARVALLGRGFGSALVLEGATEGAIVPLSHRTGVTWVGKIITETGWLGLAAFVGLLAWLFWLGLRLIVRASDPWDRALGFLMPAFVALTAGGAVYTTVLDVRAYSALFVVLSAATIAATRRPPDAPSGLAARAGSESPEAAAPAVRVSA